jgi:putative transposase
MGCPRREIDPESIYHVMSRGSNRQPIAWDRHDFESLAAGIDRMATRHEWEVFAWCVMPNHHHIVLRTPNGGFSVGFQTLNQTHSIRTNRRYGRSAHLFRNRPHVIEVRSDAHFAAVIPYVLSNPVEAGLCEHASQWPYSSYRATVGLAPAPRWLAVDAVLEFFGDAAELERIVHRRHLPVSETDGFAEPAAPPILKRE